MRYPGGKARICNYFKRIIERNLLYDCIYIEPYAGGASVALSLLFNEYVSSVVINDIDRSIYAFWYSVLNRTDELCNLIKITPVTVDNWKKQKKIQNSKDDCDLLKLGFSTFFLNRTNRSGILNAGLIGGKRQKGKWKIDARYNKQDLIKRIKEIAHYKDRIELHNIDAIKLIRMQRKGLNEQSIFYLDPPYYRKGKDLYLNSYGNNDHEKVAEEVKRIVKPRWIITYDNVKPIRDIYTFALFVVDVSFRY